MILKCRFCEYSKQENLSHDILKILADPELPTEDYMLWMDRLMKTNGLSAYRSVKVHMGRMHKDDTYMYISPDMALSTGELAIINGEAIK